jgi:GT2 family glycosyltransferase
MGEAARELPGVSILIVTRDRRADLDRLLASLRALEYPADRVEIVVVEETDDPRPLPGVHYVSIPRRDRGLGYARNLAVAAARHDVVAFTDDDCVVTADWLRELTAPLGAADVAGVAGAVLVRDTTAVGFAENTLGFPGGGLRYLVAAGGKPVPTATASTCNCCYRKAAVQEAGGFDEAARLGGEDSLLAARIAARHPLLYTPRAVVYHRARGSLGGVFRWFLRRGAAEVDAAALAPDPGAARREILRASLGFKAVVAAAAVLALRLPLLPAAAVLVTGYYGWTAWRYRYGGRYYRDPAVIAVTPLVKVAMDLGTDVGRLQRLLRRW